VSGVLRRLGTDLWWIGQRWGDRVAAAWEWAIAASLESVKVEAERRSAAARVIANPPTER